MRDFLLIYVNGRRHEIRGPRAFQSLSDFLRYDLRLTGTKVVCAEGDCGSCSVFIGTPARDGARIDYRTVTSCIQFTYQLDGAHVVTVEGLKYEGQLNPVQEAMVKCHGAQCGFCTSGFVVSMCAMFESPGVPASVGGCSTLTDDRVRAACVGNLCRCTGYEPIVRAGVEVDPTSMRTLNDLYPPRVILDDLRLHERDEVLVQADDRTCFKPTTVASAARFRADHPDCAIVSGGTDLGVQINKGICDPAVIMTTSALHELREIRCEDDALVVGATATLAELERACADALPEYARLLYSFGSPPIRSAGTLGGNIANGSPIGDTMPALYVLDAEIELTGVNGARRVRINDFYTGYRKTVMAADELITRIFIPLPHADELFKLYKVSKRKDLDIAAFTAAIRMKLRGLQLSSGVSPEHSPPQRLAHGRDPHATIEDARLAYGGVGPNIIRLRKTEEFLLNRPFTLDTLGEAGRIARTEVSPISDVRGSCDYRAQLAENILLKVFYDACDLNDASGNGHFDPDGNGRASTPRFA
jgi:xanthine dehydrogenase small subunit